MKVNIYTVMFILEWITKVENNIYHYVKKNIMIVFFTLQNIETQFRE